jgi:B12-binding domain/radical SAM domain protein
MKHHHTALVFRMTPYNRYSLALLASAVEQELPHLPLYVIDNMEKLEHIRIAHESLIVCYSFMTTHLGLALTEVRELRNAYGKTITLLAGGSHATADPEGTLAMGFDALCRGEAERVFPVYLAKLIADPRHVGKEPLFEDSGAPLSLDDYYPFSRAMGKNFPLELTRGCFYNCAFCQTRRIFKGAVRHRSLLSLLEGVRKFHNLGMKRLFFITPNAFCYGAPEAGKTELESLNNLLLALQNEGVATINLGIFPSEVRPDYVTDDVLEIVKKFCTNKKIVMGIQTGSEKMLRRLARGHTVTRAIQAVESLHRYGFLAYCDFMFGFPDETEDDMKESLDLIDMLIRRFRTKIHCHYFMPLPGTPLWGSESTPLPPDVRKKLLALKKGGNLDGCWEEQETLSHDMITWRKKGIIKV